MSQDMKKEVLKEMNKLPNVLVDVSIHTMCLANAALRKI